MRAALPFEYYIWLNAIFLFSLWGNISFFFIIASACYPMGRRDLTGSCCNFFTVKQHWGA